jgi:hypothetical protein
LKFARIRKVFSKTEKGKLEKPKKNKNKNKNRQKIIKPENTEKNEKQSKMGRGPLAFPRWQALIRPANEREIGFSNKSTEPDGFSLAFYKHYWPIIK